jgi:hypothetical protein
VSLQAHRSGTADAKFNGSRVVRAKTLGRVYSNAAKKMQQKSELPCNGGPPPSKMMDE